MTTGELLVKRNAASPAQTTTAMIRRLKLLLTGTLRSSGDFGGRAGRGFGRVGSMYGFPRKRVLPTILFYHIVAVGWAG